jgi:Uncharacterized conserved protein
MRKTIYNKLIRDRIPEIISANHQTAVISEIPENEFLSYLKTKLREEVDEFLESEDVEELADIIEVVLAILKQKNCSFYELEKIRTEKVFKNGSFDKRLLLEEVFSEK